MFGRLGIAALLTATVLPFCASTADAGARINFGYYPYEPSYDSYYPGPFYVPQPRYYYYERQIRPRRWDPAWRRPTARHLYNYDPNDPYYTETPQYYEPKIAPPRKLKKKKLAIPAKKTAPKDVAVRNESEPAPAPKKKSGAISCDKAGQIVTGYGFSSVKATSCQGDTYSFAAAREGKPYSIKLSAASGELTEVKKVK
ncbi:hypothetical protein BH10PSE7_BH10PSE7_14950 [soil metagenome]